MSDTVDYFRASKELRRDLREAYGMPCPECERLLPRANPSILLPQQACRIHRFRDPRPPLSDADYEAVGWKRASPAQAETHPEEHQP